MRTKVSTRGKLPDDDRHDARINATRFSAVPAPFLSESRCGYFGAMGSSIVTPGVTSHFKVVRLLAKQLAEVLPHHLDWPTDKTQQAFWELFPIDRVVLIARRGIPGVHVTHLRNPIAKA
jgi:hypothetical protein